MLDLSAQLSKQSLLYSYFAANGFRPAGLNDLLDDSAPVAPPKPKAPAAPAAPASGNFFSRAGDLDSFGLGGRDRVVIGRKENADLVTSRAYLNPEHAEIVKKPDGYYLKDLGSAVGTYLNDQRISGTVRLNPSDRISMADVNLLFTGDDVLYDKKYSESKTEVIRGKRISDRPIVLDAHIESRKVPNNNGGGMKELIRDINIQVREGTTVAILGTAGAGKSTVMNCLNGMETTGATGRVIFRGVDLMRDFERMQHLIGSVPQDKTFHDALTPEQELTHAAEVRLPGTTSRKEIKRRVAKTLDMLNMGPKAKSRNSQLSGGEKTRVNMGIELVADRDLLCLDEPDQGLDPENKHVVFQIMQDLAHEHGKTVLCIIHDVSEIDMFDQMVMLTKVDGVGRLAFSGTPEEARKYFGCDVRDIYGLLQKDPKKFVK